MTTRPSLFDVHPEILSLVWRDLPVKDIACLLQVCATLNYYISTDKLLWVNILHRDVTSRGIPPPPYRLDFASTDGITVRSWVQFALLLDKAYRSTEPETLGLQRIRLDKGITWLGLIRGRWVLVASSDVRQSHLSLWDTSPPDAAPRQCANISLPGPVLDGQIDDKTTEITIAVSIGSACPYVGLFHVGFASGTPRITPCGRVQSASHTRCLSGSIVGFAVWDGDDTYPCLFDWKAGNLCFLAESPRWHTNPEGPMTREDDRSFIHRSCWAMEVWNDVVIIVLDYEVHVFSRPVFTDQKSSNAYAKHIKTLPFPSLVDPVREAVIAHAPIYAKGPLLFRDTNADSSICVFIRCGWGVETYTLVRSHDSSSLLPTFELHPGHSYLSGFDYDEGNVLQIVVGSSCHKLLRLCAPHSRRDRISDATGSPPRLFITELQRASLTVMPEDVEVHRDAITFQETYLIPSNGFPLVNFWPSFAFDDARGILVMGTTRGDLCIGRYLSDIHFRDKMDDLPELTGPERDLNAITQQTVDMDLPPYYHFRAEILAGIIPDEFLEEIMRSWTEKLLPHDPIPGWSSEWSSFKNLKQWVAPTLRWGRSDVDRVDALCVEVLSAQTDCALLGDVIPVLFKDDDSQDKLIFRVGQRPYLWIGKGEENPPEFIAFLVDINVLLREANFNGAPYHDIDCSLNDEAVSCQRGCVKQYDRIVEDVAMDKLHLQLDPNPENWSKGDWKAIDDFLHPAYVLPPPECYVPMEYSPI